MKFITDDNDINNVGIGICSFYFYATWMPFNKKMLAMIKTIEEKHNAIFFAIDSDYNKSICKRYAVKSIPEIIIISGGKEIKRINGIVMLSALKSVYADIYTINR
jgi:thiol-disulfide isomerase/thioredoxin